MAFHGLGIEEAKTKPPGRLSMADFKRLRFYDLQKQIGQHSRLCPQCSHARRITDFCGERNELVRKALALNGINWSPP